MNIKEVLKWNQNGEICQPKSIRFQDLTSENSISLLVEPEGQLGEQ